MDNSYEMLIKISQENDNFPLAAVMDLLSEEWKAGYEFGYEFGKGGENVGKKTVNAYSVDKAAETKIR